MGGYVVEKVELAPPGYKAPIIYDTIQDVQVNLPELPRSDGYFITMQFI